MDRRKSFNFLYLLFGVLTVIVSARATITPEVNTTSGILVGRTESVSFGNDETKLNLFLGIPYAEPPVGKWRLNFSKQKARMPGVYQATDYKPMCPQPTNWTLAYKSRYPDSTFKTNESCLFLNIYSPANISKDSPKSVMVWIHGGTYLTGTGNMYDGKLMAALGDVIVVTINYRLGVLGYLAPRPQTIETNFGLVDQILALEWVYKNIEMFGGDPGNITLFGESAGSSSVSLLALQPTVNPMIRKVILESGTALVPWAIVSDPGSKAIEFAIETGCGDTLPNTLLNCLREKTVDEIIKGQERTLAKRALVGEIWLGPVFDRWILNFDIFQMMTLNNSLTKQFADVDHLIGTNSQEGAFLYNEQMKFFREKFNVNDSAEGMPLFVFETLSNLTAYDISPEHAPTVEQAIDYRYTDFTRANDGIRRSETYIDAVTDKGFYRGIVPVAQYHSNSSKNLAGGSTYFYYFDHRGSWESQEPWRTGADHADDVPFVFGFPFTSPYNSSEEMTLSTAMIKFWTNFAKTGNPNLPEPVDYPVTWPVYVVDEERYIRLAIDNDAGQLEGQKLAADRIAFWNDFIPKLLDSFPAPFSCPKVTLSPPCDTNGQNPLFNFVQILIVSIATLCVNFIKNV